jgi:hypothetical protein
VMSFSCHLVCDPHGLNVFDIKFERICIAYLWNFSQINIEIAIISLFMFPYKCVFCSFWNICCFFSSYFLDLSVFFVP